MMPVVYNNGNEIVQAPGLVAFRNEMIHEVRIIPLDGRQPLPGDMKSYMGSSRGHFEGNTLVVRTTNLNGKTGMQGNGMMLIPSDAIVIEERFTPVSANVLQYEVKVNDPKTWTAPWAASFPLKRDQDYQMFEYACHVGNYAMRNTLSGSRADDGKKKGQNRRASMGARTSVLLLTVCAGVAVSVAGLSAQRPPQPLFPAQPAPPPRTAPLFPVPRLAPSAPNDANAAPNLEPRVVCGMTLVPKSPSVDPKIATPEPPEKAKNPTAYTIRPVQPSICW
jgi:hypothetical protein